MQFSQVIGQQEAEGRLRQLVSEGRVPHAMLFTGPEGCGKMALALAFASYLLGERWDGQSVLDSPAAIANAEAMLAKWAHPDLHFSFPVIKPKGSGSDRQVTSIDYLKEWRQMLAAGPYFTMDQWMSLMGAENQQAQIFEAESDRLAHALAMKSGMGGRKVSVIWLPERMNQTSANKLLKLLEEPPTQTVFLLVSERPEQLLETIRSRVQLFRVKRLADSDIEQALIEKRAIDADTARRTARAAAGSWTAAVKALQSDNENRQFFDLFVMLMRKAYMRELPDLKSWSETVAAFGREKQKRMLAYFLKLVRENFIYNFHDPSLSYMTADEEQFAKNFARFVNEGNVVDMAELLQATSAQISQNANAKMQFFDMALEMIIYLRRK